MHHEPSPDRPSSSGTDPNPTRPAKVGGKKKTAMVRCAYCGTKFDRFAVNCMPFCSERCRGIDLGNWLDESYGLPYEGEGTPERFESAEMEDDRE